MEKAKLLEQKIGPINTFTPIWASKEMNNGESDYIRSNRRHMVSQSFSILKCCGHIKMWAEEVLTKAKRSLHDLHRKGG